MSVDIRQFNKDGYHHARGFFSRDDVERVRQDAKNVFITQMVHCGVIETDTPSEDEFEKAMAIYFEKDLEGFINAGKTCQHLISLHRLALSEALVEHVTELGVATPNICTRPVIYFNCRTLAKTEAFYKTPPHQDWRSMQGSLNAMVIWIPLCDINMELGALEIIPGSHVNGLLESTEDDWYRRLKDTSDEDYVPVEVEAGDALFFSAFLIHRSGNNVTDSIRWSCHFRYNDLSEQTFVERKFPNPYTYAPQQDLVTPDFPSPDLLKEYYK